VLAATNVTAAAPVLRTGPRRPNWQRPPRPASSAEADDVTDRPAAAAHSGEGTAAPSGLQLAEVAGV
jgi:hypothetical protein